MSEATSKKLPYLNEDPAKELLKEYTAKLHDLRERVQKVVEARKEGLRPSRPDDATIFDLWKMLKPPAKRLAQYVSQTIEHGRIDPLTDIELRLRLAEYEHQFLTIEDLVSRVSQKVPA